MQGMLSVCRDPHSDLPLHRLVGDDLVAFRDQFASLVDTHNFPGPLCVSIERSTLPILRKDTYWACEKSDGTRFLLTVMRFKDLKVVALVGRRDDHVYVIAMHNVPRSWYAGTVVDGELVRDRLSGGLHFLAFDALFIEGRDVRNATFTNRYHELCEALYHYTPHEGDPVFLKVKTFFPLSRLGECMSEAWQHVRDRYGCDGLVLTPENCPVVAGRNFAMFKWKEHHTVDFVVTEDGVGLSVRDRHDLVRVGTLDSPAAPGQVVECEIKEYATAVWRVVRIREDKTYPNDRLTFEKTLVNIQEAIPWQELIA